MQLQSSALPAKNSTFVLNTALTLARAYFGAVSRLAPGVARRHAERLFTTPPRFAGRLTGGLPARREWVQLGARRIAVWQAGPPHAPGVLLIHGWGGRGAQLAPLAAELVARGLRAVWFDQPGHGESGHHAVGLPDFVAAIRALDETHGPFVAAVGHSLGAGALGLALRSGVAFERVVMIAAPASMQEHTRHFARLLGIPKTVVDAMRRALERRYDVRFEDIDRLEELRRYTGPALLVHDAHDREVPFDHAQRIATHLTGARVLRTWGLGHFRVLRDAAVLGSVADFVQEPARVTPAELPALPPPAPLY